MAQFGAPNFLSALDAYSAGRDVRRRSKLEELSEEGRMLTGQALAGDQNALARLGGVDANAYMQVKQFGDAEKKAFVQDFARQAYAVQSPEQWQSLISGYKAQGRSFSPEEEKFENRQLLISKAIDLGDQMGLDLRKQEAARSQANADRSYGLQERGFAADERHRATQIDLEREKMAQPDKPSADLQEYEYAKQQGFTGSFVDYQTALKKAGATNVNVGDGQKLTEGQSKDIGFYARGSAANRDLAPLEKSLTELGGAVAGKAGLAGNYAKNPAYRRAERAGREFLAVILRKDTGAAVTPDEMNTYAPMYLPQPGDDAQTLADKKEARSRALQAIKLGLGTATNLAKDVDTQLSAEPPPQEQGFDDVSQIPEGAVVRDEQGRTFRRQGGQLVPVQ